LIADERVYGAIVFRDRIRDKDKDPSFSAKQPRGRKSMAMPLIQ
jgi:hypothetical protein